MNLQFRKYATITTTQQCCSTLWSIRWFPMASKDFCGTRARLMIQQLIIIESYFRCLSVIGDKDGNRGIFLFYTFSWQTIRKDNHILPKANGPNCVKRKPWHCANLRRAWPWRSISATRTTSTRVTSWTLVVAWQRGRSPKRMVKRLSHQDHYLIVSTSRATRSEFASNTARD